MHGSGSSIVSRILIELGVYMGTDLDSHAEAAEFFDLNEELLYRAGSAWHQPQEFLAELSRPSFAHSAAWRLVSATYGRLQSRFLASMRRERPRGAWGWKDPRTSLTLPVWLRLFPHARILDVRRETAAAAASIHRRAREEAAEPIAAASERSVSRALRLFLYPPAAARSLGRRLGRLPSFPREDPCLDADHCRRLAETYREACFRHRDLAGARLEVQYEQLLESPVDTVRMLATFALGDVPEDRIAAAAALVRRPR